jgi:hypothetical protein
MRQLVKFAVQKDGILNKLLIALKFYNTFHERPVLTREELVYEGSYQRSSHFHKYTSLYWPGEANCQDYIEEDAEGNLHLSCVEGKDIGEVVLSKGRFLFMTHFVYLLPFKKPQWVAVEDERED